MLIEQIIINFIVGLVYGILDAWKKIITFIIFIGLILFILIVMVKTGDYSITNDNFKLWYYLFTIISFMIGAQIGKRIYTYYIKK